MSDEVATISRLSESDLADIRTFADAVQISGSLHGTVEQASDALGNGFEVLDGNGKAGLVGVNLLLIEWKFSEGDNGEFVSAMAIIPQADGGIRKVVINDGSSGIYRQLRDYSDKTNRYGGLMVRKGLRRSDYEVLVMGAMKKSTTFYLDTSA